MADTAYLIGCYDNLLVACKRSHQLNFLRKASEICEIFPNYSESTFLGVKNDKRLIYFHFFHFNYEYKKIYLLQSRTHGVMGIAYDIRKD